VPPKIFFVEDLHTDCMYAYTLDPCHKEYACIQFSDKIGQVYARIQLSKRGFYTTVINDIIIIPEFERIWTCFTFF
jgi:hypothetical protein